jgi:hypothetical protein
VTRPKDKGTRRETYVVRLLQSYGLDAKRSSNNLPSKDVDLRIGDKVFAIEVKDRKQLNLHRTIVGVMNYWEDEIPAVVWHRTEKQEGAQRATPVGPTLISLPLEQFAALFGQKEESDEVEDAGGVL